MRDFTKVILIDILIFGSLWIFMTKTLKSVLKDLNSEDGEFPKNVNSVIGRGFERKTRIIELLIQYFINIGCRVIGRKTLVELDPSEFDKLILKPELSNFIIILITLEFEREDLLIW